MELLDMDLLRHIGALGKTPLSLQGGELWAFLVEEGEWGPHHWSVSLGAPAKNGLKVAQAIEDLGKGCGGGGDTE